MHRLKIKILPIIINLVDHKLKYINHSKFISTEYNILLANFLVKKAFRNFISSHYRNIFYYAFTASNPLGFTHFRRFMGNPLTLILISFQDAHPLYISFRHKLDRSRSSVTISGQHTLYQEGVNGRTKYQQRLFEEDILGEIERTSIRSPHYQGKEIFNGFNNTLRGFLTLCIFVEFIWCR